MSRIFWHGVTLLEEHEITPSYEIFYEGCELSCKFCWAKEFKGSVITPAKLVEVALLPSTRPFRSVVFVGGEPTLFLDHIFGTIDLFRKKSNDFDYVINTSFYFNRDLVPLLLKFDWIVGCVHFFSETCSLKISSKSDYPHVALERVEELLRLGAKIILRILVLPGHLDCCVKPLLKWAHKQKGHLLVNVLTNYAPRWKAKNDRDLGRMLDHIELDLLTDIIPSSLKKPVEKPLTSNFGSSLDFADPDVPIEFDSMGNVWAPFCTGSVLPLLCRFKPALSERLRYLSAN